MTTSTQTQLRRGTTSQVNAMTPAIGEAVVDTTLKQICLGDSSTAGGIKIPNASIIQTQKDIYPTASGTANAITLTTQAGYTAISAYTNGLKLSFKASSTNTTSTTVDVDGLGTKNIKKMKTGSIANLDANDITSGGVYIITYDGTQFQLQLGGGSSDSASYQATPSDPASTGSPTFEMMGLGGVITPSSSGKVMFMISGDIGGSAGGNTVGINYGTGTAPSNGASATGTNIGGNFNNNGVTIVPFARQAIVTGLTKGTAYWFDAQLKCPSGSTSIQNISMSAFEIG